MTIREQLSKELEQAPESLVEEILDFCLFIKQRQQAKVNNQATESKTNGILDPKLKFLVSFFNFIFLLPTLRLTIYGCQHIYIITPCHYPPSIKAPYQIFA
jgi:hypothetical protein